MNRTVCVCATACVTAVVSLFPALSPAAEIPGIMVLTIKNAEQATPGLAEILTELILQRLHDTKRFRVVGQKDIDQMLSTEQKKQLAGCTDTSCLVEIAGAMGTQYTLDGMVGVVGNSNVLSLTLIDVTKAAVVSKKTDVVRGEREQLLGSVHKIIYDLTRDLPELKKQAVGNKAGSGQWAMGSGGTTQSATDRAHEGRGRTTIESQSSATAVVAVPMNPYKLWGHVGFWGGLGVVGLGGVFTALASSANDDYKTGKDPAGSSDSIDRNNALAVTSYMLGGAMAATGVVLWVLSPGDEAWAKEHAVSIVPIPSTGGGALGVGGVW